ncbi:MAG: SRPBCC family protein [Gemmatimonadota bacterium]
MKHSGNLTVTTPSDREIAMSRVFDAPRNLVFDAYTKPELVRRWLGVFGGWTFEECEIDLTVGGKYRYRWNGPEGATLGIRGTFMEIERNERIVCTERFDPPFDQGEALDTVTFVERDGKTTLTIHVLSPSKQVRDAMLKSGMADGVTAGFDTLSEILASQLATVRR